MELNLLLVIAFSLVSCVRGSEENALPQCSSSLYEYNGYTYKYQQGIRVWSHCNFYSSDNPDSELCGVTKTWEDVYICDPDSLFLSAKDNRSLAEDFGDSLQDFVSSLEKDCPPAKRGAISVESIVVALVAVEAIQVPDTESADLCQNACGEIRPFYDDVRESTNSEQKMAAENFALQLLSREWKIGSCDNQLMMLYVAHHNKLWFHFGEETVKRFGKDRLDYMVVSMQAVVEDRENNTQLSDAISQSLEILQTQLHKHAKNLLSPAMILLYIFLALILVTGVGLIVMFLVSTKQKMEL